MRGEEKEEEEGRGSPVDPEERRGDETCPARGA